MNKLVLSILVLVVMGTLFLTVGCKSSCRSCPRTEPAKSGTCSASADDVEMCGACDEVKGSENCCPGK